MILTSRFTQTAVSNRLSDSFGLMLLLAGVLIFVSCQRQSFTPAVSVSGGRIGVATLPSVEDRIAGMASNEPRSGALLGVFIARYLSQAILIPVYGALQGIDAQQILATPIGSAVDHDYELLQAFVSALEVDMQEYLNRSTNRQEALDTYVIAMKNVAMRAEIRAPELEALSKDLQTTVRNQQRVVADAKKALQEVIDGKDFLTAADRQQALDEERRTLDDLKIKQDRTNQVLDTVKTLQELSAQRSLAIEKNREALITGTRVVDVPGVTDLKILEQENGNQRRSGTLRSSRSSDSIFGLPNPAEGL